LTSIFLNHQLFLCIKFLGKKLPPAKGTVDQKLTQLSSAASTGVIKHEEIPITSRDTPYALQKLLEIYKNQFLDAIETMKSDEYRDEILQQVEVEKRRKECLTLRKDQLQKHIDRLVSESTKLLRAKLEELNIPGEGATADTLLSEVSYSLFTNSWCPNFILIVLAY